jgi:hypothetical protein
MESRSSNRSQRELLSKILEEICQQTPEDKDCIFSPSKNKLSPSIFFVIGDLATTDLSQEVPESVVIRGQEIPVSIMIRERPRGG